MARVILWRHGRTGWNHTGRTQGQSDTLLDDVGLAQAAATAPAIAAVAPELIVSSDLTRTTRTAGFLAELTGLTVGLDARLRERHFGRWQGLTGDEIEQRHPQEWAAFRGGVADADPTLEPLAELGTRVATALSEIAVGLPEQGTAVVVTHGGAARAGVAALLGLPQPLWRVFSVLGNCAITDMRWHADRGWTLHAHNTTAPD